jgi:hypothetical protein
MSLGAGIGDIIGGSIASDDIAAGQSEIGNIVGQFGQMVDPYINFGDAFLNPTSNILEGSNGSGAGSNPTIGLSRLQGNGNDVTQLGNFASNFNMSPGGQYLLSTADAAQNNSAAARGGLLSGANNRALSTINTGIANTDMLSQYQAYLQGNQQQFNQLQGSLSDQFQGIGVGQTGVGQYGSVLSSEMMAQAQMAAAQAQAGAAKGQGAGQAIGGLGAMAAKF